MRVTQHINRPAPNNPAFCCVGVDENKLPAALLVAPNKLEPAALKVSKNNSKQPYLLITNFTHLCNRRTKT